MTIKANTEWGAEDERMGVKTCCVGIASCSSLDKWSHAL